MKRKPKSIEFDIQGTAPADLEYFCKTSVIDELVYQKLGLNFDRDFADELEFDVTFYLIIKTNGEYTVISKNKLLRWLYENKLDEGTFKRNKSDFAEKCIRHFVKFLVGQHKKNASLLKETTDVEEMLSEAKKQELIKNINLN